MAVLAASALARASSLAASFSSFVESGFASIAFSCAFNAASMAALAAGLAFATGSTSATFVVPCCSTTATPASVFALSTFTLAASANLRASALAASFSSVVKSGRFSISATFAV